ncbi:MAG: hypothetical protein MUO89_06235 [Dehalococcoidia bacterium]|nr:hypothetical protein [Dehalococcoidia bacterium]
MVRYKVLLTFLAIIIVVPFLFLGSPVPVHASNITVTPTSGTVGTSVRVSGDGFSGRLATIYWDKQTILGKIPISETGELTVDLQVPASCRGSHTIKIVDDSNWTGGTVSTTFAVLPGITIFPSIGVPSSQVMVTGNGFSCFEKDIKVTWNKTILPFTAAANQFGVWSISFDPPEFAKGEYYIGAFSSSTDASEIGEHKFIIGPFAKMQPSAGPVGKEVTIDGFGFRTSEDGITITWDNQIIVVNLVARANGVFSTTLKIPPSTQGHHLMGVFGSDFTPKGIVPDMDFSVVPNIQLLPASGNKGTKVTINGTGFNEGETISLAYEGSGLDTNTVADDKGSFSTDFTAPQSATKENKVKATGTAGTSAEAIFVIDKITPPAPTLISPQQGATLEAFNSVGDVFLGSAKQLSGIILFRNSEQRGLGTPDITFDWSEINVQGKTTYTLEIDNSSDSASPVILRKELADSEYTLTKVDTLNVGSYTWRVKAVDDIDNEGLWSDAREFEVIPMSNQVFIMSVVIPLIFIGAIIGLVILAWRRYKAKR